MQNSKTPEPLEQPLAESDTSNTLDRLEVSIDALRRAICGENDPAVKYAHPLKRKSSSEHVHIPG